jgi:hypothetical protein
MRAVTANVSTASPSDAPSMFYNDHPYQIDGLPLEIRDGVPYIPLIIFDFRKSTGVTSVILGSEDNFTNDFSITHVHAGVRRWIAFNIDNRDAYTYDPVNQSYREVPGAYAILSGRGGNNIYVPARAVAETIGLRFEWNREFNSVRISDGRATKTFEELLRNYSIITEPPTTRPPVTTAPPTTPTPPTEPPPPTPPQPPGPTIPTAPPETTPEPETTTPENTRDINNYLMFYSGAPPQYEDNLGQVLNYLNEHEIRAMFFMSGAEIMAAPDKLRRIFASGHDVGIKIDGSDYETPDDLISEVEAVNGYIYSLIKQKTRFYIITPDFDDVEYMKDCINELRKAGYYLCRDNINLEQADFDDIDSAVDFLKQQQVNLFAFDLYNPDNNYNYLKMMAEASDTKFYINFSHVNNANISGLVN